MNNVTSFPSNHFGHKSGNGGGGDLEARIARLESDVEYIKRDISEIKGNQQAFMERTENNFKEVQARQQAFMERTEDNFKAVRADMKSDFRLLFGALITVTLGLAGLMAKGFGWL